MRESEWVREENCTAPPTGRRWQRMQASWVTVANEEDLMDLFVFFNCTCSRPSQCQMKIIFFPTSTPVQEFTTLATGGHVTQIICQPSTELWAGGNADGHGASFLHQTISFTSVTVFQRRGRRRRRRRLSGEAAVQAEGTRLQTRS